MNLSNNPAARIFARCTCDDITECEHCRQLFEQQRATRRAAVLEEIDRERVRPSQLELVPSCDPWTDDDCAILADLPDEVFAEYYLGDQVAAGSFAQCRQVSAIKANHQLRHTLLAFRGCDSPTGSVHMEDMRRTKRTIVNASKALLLLAVGAVLGGCVTYVHKFDPHEASVLCANLASCKELPQ